MTKEPNNPGPESVLVARNIRMQRAARQITLRDLSEKSGIPLTALSRIERGERSITIDRIAAIATALGVTTSGLMDGVE